MNIPIMKYADEYIGRILCRLFGRRNAGINNIPADPKNILFIKFWGMGSIILTSPAVNLVKQKYPAAKLHYLTFEANRQVLEVPGIVDEIFTINLSNPLKFNIDTVKLVNKLRKINFDIVYDFEFFTYYSSLINRFIKQKYSVGFDNRKNWRSRLFTNTVEFNDHIHTRDNFLNLIRGSYISPSEGETERGSLQYSLVTAFLLGNQIDSSLRNYENIASPYIVINPNASKMAYERRLPADYFIKLIDELSSAGKHNIILTGSQDETNYVTAIFDKLKNKDSITNLAGKLSVNELFSLIAGAECLITNDSGPLHIASALNKPVIAFFGPESPVRYGPLSTKQLVFYRALECSPCMSVSNSKTVNCIYSEPKCMTGFDIEEIIVKTKEFLSILSEAKDPTNSTLFKKK